MSQDKGVLVLLRSLFVHYMEQTGSLSLSCIWLFVALWTVAHQVPLPMEFFRQQHWSGLPSFSRGSSQPRDWTPVCVSYTGLFFTTSSTWEAPNMNELDSKTLSISPFGPKSKVTEVSLCLQSLHFY